MANKIIKNFEELIASFFLCITIILVILNIFMRYFLKTGIPWSEEVATACFVWTVYLGASAAYKKGQHIGIDIIVKYLSGRKKQIVKIFVDLVLLAVIGFITYLSILYIMTTYRKPTPVLEISSAYISTAIPVGFTIMVVRTIQFLIRDIKELKEVGENANE
ncbi:MAG: TRAP transporter small permease [Tissierellia bacterium]|nr:TRAP transporter small permease [Tissierellia bacterium]